VFAKPAKGGLPAGFVYHTILWAFFQSLIFCMCASCCFELCLLPLIVEKYGGGAGAGWWG